jgi:hypothetical protein
MNLSITLRISERPVVLPEYPVKYGDNSRPCYNYTKVAASEKQDTNDCIKNIAGNRGVEL